MKIMDFYRVALSDVAVPFGDLSFLIVFFFFANVIRASMALGIPYLILFKLFPGTAAGTYKIPRGHKNYNLKSFIFDMRSTLVAFFFSGLMTTFFLVMVRAGVLNIYMDPNKYGYAYIVFTFILIVFLQDIYFYVTHRLLHTKWLFKHVHSVHHRRGSDVNPLISFRFHPVEIIINQLRALFLYTMFPVHPFAIIAYDAFFIFVDVLGHSGYEVLPKWWVKSKWTKWLTAFSFFHFQHHKYVNKNYALFLTIWDKLGKTIHPKYEEEFVRMKIGQELDRERLALELEREKEFENKDLSLLALENN